MGTSGYQSPEYLKGADPSPACDVYAFGVVAWQLGSLETPFRGQHPHAVIYQVNFAIGIRE